MANLTLDFLRRQLRTTLYGARCGLDNSKDNVAGANQRGGYFTGVPGLRLPIQTITTTVGTSLVPSGYIELGATTGSTNSLQMPAIPGTEFTITQTASSTLGMQVTSSGGNFNSSTGSSANTFTLWGQGASIRCVAASSTLWDVVSGLGQTTAMVSFSTF